MNNLEKYEIMRHTVEHLCSPYRGVLAADESIGTIEKRFQKIGLDNTRLNRQKYRDMLFTTPNLEEFISGVIVYEETLFDTYDPNGNNGNNGNNGTTAYRLVQPLLDKGILVGIKTDCGLGNIPLNCNNEKLTLGLDTLSTRSTKYFAAGARFAKWRCVFDTNSSDYAIQINADILARYASISQECGLVPVVEPEVLVENDCTLDDCERITRRVLSEVYYALNRYGTRLDLTLLKPNMIRAGEKSGVVVPNSEIASRTVRVLRDIVPPSVPGVVFLSGGMSEGDSTDCLRLINEFNHDHGCKPWRLSFSYGRALQDSAIKIWNGKDENVVNAQRALYIRAKDNGVASMSHLIDCPMDIVGADIDADVDRETVCDKESIESTASIESVDSCNNINGKVFYIHMNDETI